MSVIRRDVDAQTSVTKALGPVSIATDTTTTSAAIDLSSYPGWRVLLIGSSGTYTDGSYTFSVTQCATSGGSYSALAASSGTLTAVTAANTTRTAAYTPTLPYLKVNIVSASTTSGALLSAHIILLPPK